MSKSIWKLVIGLAASFMLSAAPAPAQNDAASADNADAEPLAPPTNFTATDHDWDNGTQVDLSWDPSPDTRVFQYWLYKRKIAIGGQDVDAEWELIEPVEADATSFEVTNLANQIGLGDLEKYEDATDVQALVDSDHRHFDVSFVFRIVARAEDGTQSSPVETGPIRPKAEWFYGARGYLAIIVMIFCFAVIFWIFHARSGRPIKVRKIAGLEAVDEAVGRATEMGRPCLYVPGIQDINEIQTIAGLTILSRVAKTAAEYDAKVEVPTARSLVMTTARETVQAAYMAAGRPDAYNQDLIYYVTDEQFGYVAYLQGMMVREKPAACFYMGAFFAESLILAETGNGIGAIQVAGTAMPAQLPFFVAACDYTLIGEEFFAASAYLSGSPEELGSLKGQDVGKLIVAVLLVLGVLMFTLGNIVGPSTTFGAMLLTWVNYLKHTILT